MGHVIERILAGAGIITLALALSWCVGFGVASFMDDRNRNDPFITTMQGITLIVVTIAIFVFLYATGALLMG